MLAYLGEAPFQFLIGTLKTWGGNDGIGIVRQVSIPYRNAKNP